MEGSTGTVKHLLETELAKLREEMKHPQPEIIQDFQLVKNEVQSCVSAMSSDMKRFEDELVDIKDIINSLPGEVHFL